MHRAIIARAIHDLAEAGGVDWLSVGCVAVVQVVDVDSTARNTDTFSDFIVLFQPARQHQRYHSKYHARIDSHHTCCYIYNESGKQVNQCIHFITPANNVRF